jgi:hypothetical protein
MDTVSVEQADRNNNRSATNGMFMMLIFKQMYAAFELKKRTLISFIR